MPILGILKISILLCRSCEGLNLTSVLNVHLMLTNVHKNTVAIHPFLLKLNKREAVVDPMLVSSYI